MAGKQTKKKAETPVRTQREEYVHQLLIKNNLTLPSLEDMQRRQINAGLTPIPLSELAVFCHPDRWTNTPGLLGKCLDEVSGYFGGRNFLNLAAEVEVKNVERVILELLDDGQLINEIKTCTVLDIPENIDVDPNLNQVWDGRHRALAFAVLYGPDIKIYVTTEVCEFLESAKFCMKSNDTRPIKKMEAAAIEGLKYSDAHKAFKAYKGKTKNISKWLVSQCTPGLVAAPCIHQIHSVNIVERLSGKKGITAAMMRSVWEYALSKLNNHFDVFRWTPNNRAICNYIVATFTAVFKAIDARSGGRKASTAWNSYSSNMLGRFIGEALNYWITNGGVTPERINEFADNVAEMVCAYMDFDPTGYSKDSTIESAFIAYGYEKFHITLPKVEVNLASLEDAEDELGTVSIDMD